MPQRHAAELLNCDCSSRIKTEEQPARGLVEHDHTALVWRQLVKLALSAHP